MASLQNILKKLNSNVILKNVILAVCAILIFVFLISILLNVFTRHNRSEEVPDFSGMTMEEALRAAKPASLRIEINDSLYVPAYEGGIILDQLPKPGTRVKSGRRVFVTTNSFHQKMVRIPYVTGYSLRQAKNNLEVAGLGIDKLIFKPDIANYNVLEQRYNDKIIGPGSKTEAEQGSGVTLIVGVTSDARLPAAPKAVGLTLNEARSRIWEAGLNVGKVEFEEGITLLNRNEARVFEQKPAYGTRVRPGTEITLRLTLDTDKVSEKSTSADKAARRTITVEQAQ